MEALSAQALGLRFGRLYRRLKVHHKRMFYDSTTSYAIDHTTSQAMYEFSNVSQLVLREQISFVRSLAIVYAFIAVASIPERRTQPQSLSAILS